MTYIGIEERPEQLIKMMLNANLLGEAAKICYWTLMDEDSKYEYAELKLAICEQEQEILGVLPPGFKVIRSKGTRQNLIKGEWQEAPVYALIYNKLLPEIKGDARFWLENTQKLYKEAQSAFANQIFKHSLKDGANSEGNAVNIPVLKLYSKEEHGQHVKETKQKKQSQLNRQDRQDRREKIRKQKGGQAWDIPLS